VYRWAFDSIMWYNKVEPNVPDRETRFDLNRAVPALERVSTWQEQNIDHVVVLEQCHAELDRIEGVVACARCRPSARPVGRFVWIVDAERLVPWCG